MSALALHGLTKRYDGELLALDHVDLTIEAGDFFGFPGPNGAGKTTLISAVCNLIRVTEGEARVFGHPHDSLEARRLVGLAEQDVNLDRFLDVEETLVYHGGYYGMSRREARRRAHEMMDVFDLRAKARTRAPKLSGGMRRRCSRGRSCTSRAWSSSTSRPRAWTSSCGSSCGAKSAGCTRRGRRSCSPRITSRRPRSCAARSR